MESRRRSDLDAELLAIADGRPVGRSHDPVALVAAATAHRLVGLVRDREQELDLPGHVRADLLRMDLAQQSLTARAWTVWSALGAQLDVDLVLLKGVGTQARWYDRPGQRAMSDLDVWLAPHHLDRVGEVVRTLAPDHDLAAHIQALVTAGNTQNIEVPVGGIMVDLHMDVLKLGVPMRGGQDWWDGTRTIVGPGDATARVLSPEATLIHHVIHLTKDRFRSLAGYVDIARIVRSGDITWSRLETLARAEGLLGHVWRGLGVVNELLPLGIELREPVRDWRDWVWHRAWRPEVRLAGPAGLVRYRHRQDLLPLTADGRTLEWLRTQWRQRLLPPAASVAYRYPDETGPYLWRLTAGRLRATLDRMRQRADLSG